jgi:hypothetical protein
VKVVSVAREVNRIEEACQDPSYLFWQEDYGNKGHNPVKYILGSSRSEKLISVARKPNTIEVRQEQNWLFLQRDYKKKGHRSEELF